MCAEVERGGDGELGCGRQRRSTFKRFQSLAVRTRTLDEFKASVVVVFCVSADLL